MNGAGTIVGYSYDTNGSSHPVVWNSRGRISPLAALPDSTWSTVSGVNADGTIVGSSGTGTAGRIRAVRWDSVGRITDLGAWSPDEPTTIGSAINNHGTIVGHGSVENNRYFHALLWGRSGQITDLGTLAGGTYSSAWRINSRGIVIGQAQAADGEHAVLWRTTTAG